MALFLWFKEGVTQMVRDKVNQQGCQTAACNLRHQMGGFGTPCVGGGSDWSNGGPDTTCFLHKTWELNLERFRNFAALLDVEAIQTLLLDA